MAIFQPVDMMGPAHRGGQIQVLAQNAAKNVMMRQRMRALIQSGAQRAGGGASVDVSRGFGGGQRLQGSMRAHPVGVRGATMGPAGGNMETLAQMLTSASQRAQSPGGDSYGQFGAGGGGFDFASLPGQADPAQSTQSELPGAVTAAPAAPDASAAAPIAPPSTTTGQAIPTTDSPMTGGSQGAVDQTPQIQDPGLSGLIHLGGGMYYDPATDSIRGGGALGIGTPQQSLQTTRAGR